MRRFSKRFRTPRPSLGGESSSRQNSTQQHRQQHAPTNAGHTSTAVGGVADAVPLDAIADELRVMGRRIEDLKGLVNANRTLGAQVADIKRGLRDTHRNVEHFQTTTCALGGEIEALAQDMTMYSWQAYKSAVLVEEKLKVLLETQGSSVGDGVSQRDRISVKEQPAAGVYIPTGAQKRAGSLRRESFRNLRLATRFEAVKQHDAIPETVDSDVETLSTASGSTMSTVRDTQYHVRSASFASSTSSESPSSDTSLDPQPIAHVKSQIQREEANAKLGLNAEHTVRQGSRDGASITHMVMSGYQNEAILLPNLHYIKVHELRALINWMTNTSALHASGSISRAEKVLHCLQLLQTGCRYESIAVLFSRSPAQAKACCLEVMGALLRLHRATVNQTPGQEMYMPLWSIWRRFEATEGRAGAYYGFLWMDLAKVLVTLNLYIARWRMQGMFATDGPAFLWGRFFVARGADGVAARGGVVEAGCATGGGAGDEDEGSCSARVV